MKTKIRTKVQGIISTLLIIAVLFIPSLGFAASLTDLTDTLSTLKKSTAADHTITFKSPSGATTSAETIIVTFQSGFSVATLETTSIELGIATSNATCSAATYAEWNLGGAAAAGIWGVATSSQTITFTTPTNASSTTFTAGYCARIRIGSNAVTQTTGVTTIVNPSSAANYTVAYSGTFNDTGTTTIPILDNDQVQLTANVPQSVTFSISTTTAYFGNLLTGSAQFASSTNVAGDTVETVANTLIACTNASFGYSLTALGATLTSGAYTINAIGGTAASSTPGTEQFGMRLSASGGIGAVTSPYAFTTSYAYNATTTKQVASATGATANTTYSAYYVANIAANTESASYSTAITYVATANY